MVNAMKHPVLKAFDNVDKAVYDEKIQWWAEDIVDTFGDFLSDIYAECVELHDREKQMRNEVLDWFYGRETVEASAAYCMQCLNLLQNQREWDECFCNGCDDAIHNSERGVAETILSYIADDVTTEVITRMELLLAKENE